MAASKRNWGLRPGRDPRPPCKAPRLYPELSCSWRQEAPKAADGQGRGCSPSPSQLLALLRSHFGQGPRGHGSPGLSAGQVYHILQGIRRALERATGLSEVQPVLDLVLQPAFLQNLLGFIATLEAFCCEDGQLSPAVLGDTVAALHYLLQSCPSHAQTLLCYPVDLLHAAIQRLQSRGFQFSWIVQKQLHDLRGLLDKAFPAQGGCGREGPVSVAVRDNFCEIPVFPTAEDLFLEPTWKLKPNRISGSYQSEGAYLDTHFRLLREDMIRPLRDGISAQFSLQSLFSHSQKPSGELLLYRDVRLVRVDGSPLGAMYLAEFRTKRGAMDPCSKRLQSGSLVCLISSDCDGVFFGTVAGQNKKELPQGAVWLHVQESHTSVMRHFRRTAFIMVESPAFFEAYRHVLEGLQEMHAGPVPFGRYIVQCCRDVSRPAYLLDQLAAFDLSALCPPRGKSAVDIPSETSPETDVPLVDLKAVSPFCDHFWTPKIFPSLDESQILAIQMALSTEFVLIQGPPGTGKTFIGLKILEILLNNQTHWNADHIPCLVVCYTNHALDQFLEGILEVHPTGVVRVGGRSKNERVMQQALKNLRTRFLLSKEQVLRNLRSLKNRIASREELLQLLSWGVLAEQELKEEITKDHLWMPKGRMLPWLKIQPRPETDPPQERQPSSTRNKKGRGFPQDDWDERFLEEDEEEEDLGQSRSLAHAKSKFAYLVPVEERNPQNWLLARLREADAMTDAEVAKVRHTEQLYPKDRWRLYRRWAAAYEKELKAALVELLKSYEKDAAELEEMNFHQDLQILKRSRVIGMTTTGAAKYRKLLQSIRPRIVIVEEAAEIFEAHVLTALTTSCQHLILIGDHQQLRPKPADYSLEKKFHLGISLFERMVLNKLPHVQLLYQHRMRPEISQLLVPFFYKELRDHTAVLDYDEIKGVEQSVFFVQHREEESHRANLESYSNGHEAAFLAALVRYLLMQGYSRRQITILTPYHGQVMRIRDLLRTRAEEKEEEEVAVHAVDDFQGEENDIVLLSLVRSNSEGKVGFLKDKNRLCVALSRAKKGFYCIGNLEHLSAHCRLWEEMLSVLRAKQLLGDALTLVCQNHPETKAAVRDSRDFSRVPDGGCELKCQVRLACGHPCPRHCHPYKEDHSLTKCREPCSKILCELNHRCPKKCWETCGLCQVRVEKVIPKCGHCQKVPCHVPEDKWICTELCQKVLACSHLCRLRCGDCCEAVLCHETVQVTLPCSHMANTECFRQEEPLPCSVKCQKKLECGHICKGSCYECLQGRLHAACQKKCTRVLLCSHVCQGSCCENCPPCKNKCLTWCQHSHCDKRCGEICFPCKQPCAWKCKHHRCTRTCSEVCDRPRCYQPCPKTLRCKHPCVGLCGEPCPPKCRVCHRDELTEIFFGEEDEPDSRFVLLQDCGHVFEVGGLDRWMDGEADGAQPQSVQQKVCPKCSTPVQCNPRYNDVVKTTRQRIEEVKLKIRGSKEELRAQRMTVFSRLNKLPSAVCCSEMQLWPMKRQGTLQSLRDWENIVNFLLCIQKLKDQAQKCTADRKQQLTAAVEAVESWLRRRKAEETLTSQQLRECQKEIRRISYWANILERLSGYESSQVPAPPEALAAVEEALGLLRQPEPFTEAQEGPLQAILETIDKLMPTTGLRLSEAERVSVIEAMRFGKGHWYRCPQGHLYAIGECGRPMQESRCPECGATIGGQDHRLRSDNAVVDPLMSPGEGTGAEGRRLGDLGELAGSSDDLALLAPGSASPFQTPGSLSTISDSPSETEGSPCHSPVATRESPASLESIESLQVLDATSGSSEDELDLGTWEGQRSLQAAPAPGGGASRGSSPVLADSEEEEAELILPKE